MKNQDPPVYRASYELSITILRFARDLPDKYRSNLSLILQSKTIEMQDLVYRINDKADKSEAISQVLSRAYFIRMTLRLFLDLGIMKSEANMIINMKIDDLIFQLSSWKKSLNSV